MEILHLDAEFSLQFLKPSQPTPLAGVRLPESVLFSSYERMTTLAIDHALRALESEHLAILERLKPSETVTIYAPPRTDADLLAETPPSFHGRGLVFHHIDDGVIYVLAYVRTDRI